MQRNQMIARRQGRFQLKPLLLAALAFAPAAASAQQDAAAAQLPPLVITADGEKAKFAGILVDRQGDKLRVREGNTALHVVLLTDDTKISTPKGLFKMERKRRGVDDLLPGLMLQVEGTGSSDGAIVAKEIHFSTRSMKTAQQINVGSEVIRGNVAANTDSITHLNARVTNLDNYDEKFATQVNFVSNEWSLLPAAKGQLDDLAGKASALKGYIVEVKGYADTTGSTPHNLELSEMRAQAVVRYLIEDKGIPMRRVLNPTGFGDANAIASNATPDGRAMNRRVTVRVLVNKGLAEDHR
jgi:outer membrane protein OmpA-like peptidoglycan-associated protein